ncbi:MAG: chorismate synthase, partial [Oscillospiraceae bacterium]|nr:chorismate synthase [Oscillospiraceae bacterium]
VRTHSNMHGGILGGISSGMPITLRVAIKPTGAAGVQETVNLSTMKTEKLEVENGVEACIVPRAVPCVEACVNIALLSHMLDYPHFT